MGNPLTTIGAQRTHDDYWRGSVSYVGYNGRIETDLSMLKRVDYAEAMQDARIMASVIEATPAHKRGRIV